MPSVTTRPCPADARAALEQAGLAPAWARLYAARGVTHPEQVAHRLPQLLPPAGLLHIERAAALLADAIARQATPAHRRRLRLPTAPPPARSACAACACSARRSTYLVPNRFEHGYGLTPDIVQLRRGTPARPAGHRGQRHRQRRGRGRRRTRSACRCWSPTTTCPATRCRTPPCIVNPNQPGCGFASKNLAGVGVMFYVLLALRAELRRRGAFDAQSRTQAATRCSTWSRWAPWPTWSSSTPTTARLVAQGLKRMRAGAMPAPASPRCSRRPARDPARRHHLRPRLRARPAPQRRRPPDGHDAGHRMPADRRRRAAPTNWRARSTRINRDRRDIEADMREQALRDRSTRFDPADEPQPASACSTPTSTRAWSASSPRASRTSCTGPRSSFAASRRRQRARAQGLGPLDPRPAPARRAGPGRQAPSRPAPAFGGHAMAAGLSLPAGRQERSARRSRRWCAN